MINGVDMEYKRNERSVFYGIADVADISRKRQLWTWCARVKNSEGAAMPSRGDRRMVTTRWKIMLAVYRRAGNAPGSVA